MPGERKDDTTTPPDPASRPATAAAEAAARAARAAAYLDLWEAAVSWLAAAARPDGHPPAP
ncbi:MAG: hypothetical protein KatS3mg118_1485 [Paracoccaceae bacterium]|nr:MAG: hypothetical protein KatS3mg118_1485 [Paracoccaceae bacterium]